MPIAVDISERCEDCVTTRMFGRKATVAATLAASLVRYVSLARNYLKASAYGLATLKRHNLGSAGSGADSI